MAGLRSPVDGMIDHQYQLLLVVCAASVQSALITAANINNRLFNVVLDLSLTMLYVCVVVCDVEALMSSYVSSR